MEGRQQCNAKMHIWKTEIQALEEWKAEIETLEMESRIRGSGNMENRNCSYGRSFEIGY